MSNNTIRNTFATLMIASSIFLFWEKALAKTLSATEKSTHKIELTHKLSDSITVADALPEDRFIMLSALSDVVSQIDVKQYANHLQDIKNWLQNVWIEKALYDGDSDTFNELLQKHQITCEIIEWKVCFPMVPLTWSIQVWDEIKRFSLTFFVYYDPSNNDASMWTSSRFLDWSWQAWVNFKAIEDYTQDIEWLSVIVLGQESTHTFFDLLYPGLPAQLNEAFVEISSFDKSHQYLKMTMRSTMLYYLLYQQDWGSLIATYDAINKNAYWVQMNRNYKLQLSLYIYTLYQVLTQDQKNIIDDFFAQKLLVWDWLSFDTDTWNELLDKLSLTEEQYEMTQTLYKETLLYNQELMKIKILKK